MYAELHAHSAFSFLDGASLPDELATAAAELGYDAFALTDHNGVSGSMEFAQAAKGLGMRPHVAHCHLGHGKLYRRTSKPEQAREHLTTATTMYREMGMTYWLEQAETASMETGA